MGNNCNFEEFYLPDTGNFRKVTVMLGSNCNSFRVTSVGQIEHFKSYSYYPFLTVKSTNVAT